MNPLQEHPHLFANGIFQVMWPDGTSIWIDGNVLMEFEDWENEYPPQAEPKLIARPISDLTDEEEERFGMSKENMLYWLKRKGELGFKRSLRLLSIGVLPFPQTLFDDGTVISKAELKTKEL